MPVKVKQPGGGISAQGAKQEAAVHLQRAPRMSLHHSVQKTIKRAGHCMLQQQNPKECTDVKQPNTSTHRAISCIHSRDDRSLQAMCGPHALPKLKMPQHR